MGTRRKKEETASKSKAGPRKKKKKRTSRIGCNLDPQHFRCCLRIPPRYPTSNHHKIPCYATRTSLRVQSWPPQRKRAVYFARNFPAAPDSCALSSTALELTSRKRPAHPGHPGLPLSKAENETTLPVGTPML